MAHLCTRPFPGTSLMNPFGRETAIQKGIWTEDGWLRLSHGGKLPTLETEVPNMPSHPFPAEEPRDHFIINPSFTAIIFHRGYVQAQG
ncbi:hypothetical protein [Paenibacillus polymyxa]|uniref:hypothetical protein n=1 Tax=Paenibacillus polymyxa TaxID=1406 RepID=UPI0004704D94|nr:hypothetical protein [Paenibacillus polymyxa]